MAEAREGSGKFKGYGEAMEEGVRAPRDCVRNVDELPPEPYERPAAGIAGVSRNIGAAVGTRLLGVDLTEIPPGRRSSYLHHHSKKEEFFFVVSGRCRVRIGAESFDLRPGDAVARPAGTGLPHVFDNPHAEPCRVLMFGVMAGRGVEDEVLWPELGRVLSVDPEGKTTTRRVPRGKAA